MSADSAPAPATEPTVKAKAGEAWDKTKDVASDTYDSVKDATMSAAGRLERATYDERMEIKASLTAAGAEFDAEMAEWNREGKTVSSATKERLADAKTEFNQSLNALGSATAEGWEAAKAKTTSAWTKLKAAYNEAKAN